MGLEERILPFRRELANGRPSPIDQWAQPHVTTAVVAEFMRNNRLELLERKRLEERESDAHHSSTTQPKHAATFGHPGVHVVDQVQSSG
jgi:hypothetical protein